MERAQKTEEEENVSELREPLIHSHITDDLPEDHQNAFKSLFCKSCQVMVHAFNNECMQTWVETGCGDYCLRCFAALPDSDALEDDYGLK